MGDRRLGGVAMTHSELNKGLILTFNALPGRIKKLEKYSQSHVKERALNYIKSSMTLSLGKERK